MKGSYKLSKKSIGVAGGSPAERSGYFNLILSSGGKGDMEVAEGTAREMEWVRDIVQEVLEFVQLIEDSEDRE